MAIQVKTWGCFSSGSPRKRDSLWSWLVCACALMTWVASLGLLFSFGIFLPVFMDYFNESREATAWVGSLAIAITFFTGQVSNALVTRFGCRITTLIGGVFCTVSLICSSFVDNMKVLFFTYSLLFGLGSSCVSSAGLVVISQYFKKRQLLATGLLTGGHGGGVLIMGPTLEALIRAIGWKNAYRIMAGVAFVLCSLAITFDPNVEKDAEEKDKGEREEIKDGENDNLIRTKMKKVFDFSVWKVPSVIAIVLAACVVEFGHFVPQIHLIRYCEDLGISAEKASKLFIYYGGCSAIGRVLARILCSHRRINAFFIFQAAEFVAGLSTILVTLTSSYSWLVVYIVIYGLSDGVFFTSLSINLLTACPLKTPAVLGWEMLLASLTLANGPPLAGMAADMLGSYVIPFQVAGGITIAGSFIPFMLLCYKRQDSYTPSTGSGDEEAKKLEEVA